jgi:hypothetical protein
MNIHEQYADLSLRKPSSNRTFGLVIGSFFVILALLPLIAGAPVRRWALAIALTMYTLAVLWPATLRIPNLAWMRVGMLLHRITSPLVTGLLFWGVFTPLGFLMRATGKDPLRLRLDPSAKSYWIDRSPPGPEPRTMLKQF